jgi:hypothetical protein
MINKYEDFILYKFSKKEKKLLQNKEDRWLEILFFIEIVDTKP